MGKSRTLKIWSKVKEFLKSLVKLDYDATNIWEKRQNLISAFFPLIPIFVFCTFKKGSLLADTYQIKIALTSFTILAIIIKSKKFFKRIFLSLQLGLTLLMSVLILSKFLKQSDLNIPIQFIVSLVYLEQTIEAFIALIYESNPQILKIKMWIRLLLFIGFGSTVFVVISLFSELNISNVFIITAVYGVLMKLTQPKTLLSFFDPSNQDIDSYELRKNYKWNFNLAKIFLTMFYLSLLIMISIFSDTKSVFYHEILSKGIILANKAIATVAICWIFILVYGSLVYLVKKQDYVNKWFEKTDKPSEKGGIKENKSSSSKKN